MHTLPAVAALKKALPSARLRWLINPEWAPLLRENPHVDEVVLFPRNEFRGGRGIPRLARWARSMAREKAELIIDFQGLLRSALIARLCRAPDGEIVGLSDAREGSRWLYDAVIDVSAERHAVDRNLAVVKGMGISTAGPLEWPLPAGDPLKGFGVQEFVLLHPYARGAGKSLTCGEVTDFCQSLAPATVVVAGRAGEAVPSEKNVTDMVNRTTLLELVWLIRQARFVVSVDSGPMHIAAALTENLLALHRWSDPRKVGPHRRGAWVWKAGLISRVGDTSEATNSAAGMPEIASFVRDRLRA